MNPDTPQYHYFLEKLFQPSQTDLFTAPELLLAMTVSSLLCFVLANVYRRTHRGTSYSQSFMVTMFMMSVATSVVMMIIGSNIARAFSLVGALSIIRFRTAVKDSRDTGYLFAAMIIGMGCGTGFYLASVSLTLFVSLLMFLLYVTDFGLKQQLESIVRVTYQVNEHTLGKIEGELDRSFRDFKLINRILDYAEDEETNVYVIRPRDHTSAKEFELRLRNLEGVRSVSMYQSDQHDPF